MILAATDSTVIATGISVAVVILGALIAGLTVLVPKIVNLIKVIMQGIDDLRGHTQALQENTAATKQVDQSLNLNTVKTEQATASLQANTAVTQENTAQTKGAP